MRILFVLPCFPYPAVDGGRAKVFNVLKFLAERHACDLICLDTLNGVDVSGLRQQIPAIGNVWIVPPPHVLARIIRTLTNLLLLSPPSFGRYSSPAMAARITDVKRAYRYDVIHYDIINMAPYQKANRDIPSVHSPNDATSLVYRRLSGQAPSIVAKLRLRVVAWLLSRFERTSYGTFTKVHVVSETDRDYLLQSSPGADVEVIPITSGYPSIIPFPEGGKVAEGPTITVCGNLGDSAIAAGFREFLDLVMPRVCAAFPRLRVRVLGRRIDASLRQLLERHSNIEYLAWVENFEAFLASADVLLLPDRAGAPGAKTRTVQAMALGKAILGSETAFEGIQIERGQHGAIYTTPDECFNWLNLLLADTSLRKGMGAAAAQLAADVYSIERIGPRYEAMYLQAIQRHRAQAQAHRDVSWMSSPFI